MFICKILRWILHREKIRPIQMLELFQNNNTGAQVLLGEQRPSMTSLTQTEKCILNVRATSAPITKNQTSHKAKHWSKRGETFTTKLPIILLWSLIGRECGKRFANQPEIVLHELFHSPVLWLASRETCQCRTNAASKRCYRTTRFPAEGMKLLEWDSTVKKKKKSVIKLRFKAGSFFRPTLPT